jgi:ATP-dependent helicase/nuclease subunit A
VIALVDAPSRNVIATSGLTRTLFVEAGAGTGKTSLLVRRVVDLVLRHEVDLTALAAITFTEAAAAELQSRIREEFEREEQATTDAATRERCRQALADTDRATITTLHGFASRLLGEFSIQAGLPPRVTILDEVASQLAREDRWQRFVDALYDDPANEELLVRALLVGIPLEARYRNQATLKDVAAELGQSWDRLGPISERVPPPLQPLDFAPFDRAVAELSVMVDCCTDPDDKLYLHLTEVLLPSMLDVVAVDDSHAKLRALHAGKWWGPGNGGKNAAWDGDAGATKALIRAVVEARATMVASVADEVLDHFRVAVAREVVASAHARRDEGGLEFHDLLVLAHELLRSHPEVRRVLHDRYQQLLLDEFQDTDPIQIDLALLIAASVEGTDPGTWEVLGADEGRLFFVGDPKQSIYRFRRADIELFLRARDRFGVGDRLVRLVTNFRTVAPVIEWVNGLFGQLMAAEVEGRQAAYEPLEAFRSPSDHGDHRPLLLGGPHEQARADELREYEADDVATAIAHLRDQPDAWPVYDQREQRWRPARLADVTVLVPTRTSLPFLRRALDAWAIPFRLDTGTLVYDTQEVRDALAAIRAIDDPTDQVDLVAALRSPLYACSDPELFSFKLAGGRFDLCAPIPGALPDDDPVRLALEHLHSLWEERRWLAPSALLHRLLDERRAFILAFGTARPNEVWRRLRFLVDQARAFEDAGGGGLRAFVDWAELQRADGARVHEPLLPETDDDAVRILTIHSAKGLEFPITVLSGLTTKPGGRRFGPSIVWSDEGLPEVRLRKGLATGNYDPWADVEDEMDDYEKLRLLYVACTRARDHLVVACHHKSADGSYASRIWDLMDQMQGSSRRLDDLVLAPPNAVVDEPPGAPAPPVDDREQWKLRRAALLKPQRRSRVISATGIARSAQAAEAAGELPDDVDLAGETIGDDGSTALAPRRRGRAGTAIGRAVHATLQVLDLRAPQGIDEQAARQADVEAIPELAGTVATMVRAALASDAVAFAAAYPHHKELYLASPVGDRVIEGYVDLLIETPDGLVVVDWKTDGVRGEAEIAEKLAAYTLQGAAYAVALEQVTGQPVVDCRFVFCAADGAVERQVSDLEAAKHRVRDAVLGAGG